MKSYVYNDMGLCVIKKNNKYPINFEIMDKMVQEQKGYQPVVKTLIICSNL